MEWEALTALTDQRMGDPQAGDVFHEMYSYWVTIIAREGNNVTTREEVGGEIKSETVHYSSVGEFQKKFAYETCPGYSIVYYDCPVNAQATASASALTTT